MTTWSVPIPTTASSSVTNFSSGTSTTASNFFVTTSGASGLVVTVPYQARVRRDADLGNSVSDLALKEWLFYALRNQDHTENNIFEAIDKSIIVLQETENRDNYRIVQTRDSMDKLSIALKKLVFQEGQSATLTLPDGSILKLKGDASYSIEDAHCNVRYRANRIRDFNKFVAGSDLLEEFLEFLKSNGYSKSQALNKISIKHFIEWLVVEAAKADGEEAPDYYPTEQTIIQEITQSNTCRYCSASLPDHYASNGINFCSGDHMNLHLESLQTPKISQNQPKPNIEKAVLMNI